MYQRNLLLTILLLISISVFAQTEDFEGEAVGGTTFETDNVIFNTSGDLIISEFNDFSCDGSTGPNRYLDSGYLNGGSNGVIGSFSTADTSLSFEVSTTSPQCGWVGSADGEQQSAGSIRFTGTTTENTIISEDFELESVTFTDLIPFTFSDAIWGGIYLKSIEIEIVSTQDSTDYFALDNFVFESLNTVSISELDANKIQIFPNPTTGIIELTGVEYDGLKVMDNLGRVQLEAWDQVSKVDISILPGGIYFVQVITDNLIITKKIFKE